MIVIFSFTAVHISINDSLPAFTIVAMMDLRHITGTSIEQMLDAAYYSFEVLIEETKKLPVHLNDIYEVVIFDLIQCNTHQ
jgi:hypothetical protein